MMETAPQITDISSKAKAVVPPTHLPPESSALIPMPPSSLIAVEQSLKQPEYQRRSREKTLSVKDQQLKTRAGEIMGKIVDHIVETRRDAAEEKIDPEKFTTYSSGAYFPRAKLGPEGTKAAEAVLEKCEPIDYDRGVAQENGAFFTADPMEDSAKSLLVNLKTQKQAARNRIRGEVAAEFRRVKKRIKASPEFKAEVKARLLEDEQARYIASKEAIYSQIVKDRRNKRISKQREWLLENDPELALPAKESVSSSGETLKQTRKLVLEVEHEIRQLERQVKADIVAEIKKDNVSQPRGQKAKIRNNPEIDTKMHKRMSDNLHVKELASRGVSLLQLQQQIKAERREIQRKRTEAQFKATRIAQHQDAIIEQLGLRDSYRYPRVLETDKVKNKESTLRESLRWEELVRESLALRLAESSQKLEGLRKAEYQHTYDPRDGKIIFANKKIEDQITALTHKTTRRFRTTRGVLTGSLSRADLTQLRTQATAEVKHLIAQKEVQELEARRAATEMQVTMEIASSRRHESIGQRLRRFIRNAKRDPRVIGDSLVNLVKNRKIQLAAISGLNAVGMGISGTNIISPREAIVVSVPSNYWINQKLGESLSTSNTPNTVTGNPPTQDAVSAATASTVSETSSDAVKLAAERTTVEPAGISEQDILRKELRSAKKDIAAVEIARLTFAVPPVPSFDIKAPPPPYGKEGRMSGNPMLRVIPNLQRSEKVGIGDVDVGILDIVQHDTNVRLIRLSNSDINWDYTVKVIEAANKRGMKPRVVYERFALPSLVEWDDFLNQFEKLPVEKLPDSIIFGNEIGGHTAGHPGDLTAEDKAAGHHYTYYNNSHESIYDAKNGMPAYLKKLYDTLKRIKTKTGKEVKMPITSTEWNFDAVPGNLEKYYQAVQKAGIDLNDPMVTFDTHVFAAIDAPFPINNAANGPERIVELKNILVKLGVKDPRIDVSEFWFGDDYNPDQLQRIIKYFVDDLGVNSVILFPHKGTF